MCTLLMVLSISCLVPALVLAGRAGFVRWWRISEADEMFGQARSVAPRTVAIAIIGGVAGLFAVAAVMAGVGC
jgi:hypothetical protein